jgi:hypothetical protein
MQTQCKQTELEFQGLHRRRVVGRFDGGNVSSDGGGLLLREVAERTGILERFAGCFEDYRRDGQVEHTVQEMVSQRVYGIALGYEDVSDHDELRRDPLFATLVGKADPTGGDRPRHRDRGCALAGKSTLNRLETTPAVGAEADRYKRISYRSEGIDRLLVEVFLDAHAEPPGEIVLDLDATDDPLHGEQEGRFFHGYYREYCYLPLYIFSGSFVLCARLRCSDGDGSAGSLDELGRIVEQIRARWPGVRIIIRGDADFCRDEILSWCEANGVDYVVGMAKNARLLKKIRKQMEHARRKHLVSGEAVRVFRSFTYRTLESWSRRRRVVAKAEHLDKGANPRFVVTSLSEQEHAAREAYEELYCARGDMENRIKEQQLYLFADRTSSHTMRANQLRLYFSTIAYVLLNELRRVGLRGTELARAQACTIRAKLLKIGVIVRVSVRRVRLALSSGYPYKALFSTVLRNLSCAYPLRV